MSDKPFTIELSDVSRRLLNELRAIRTAIAKNRAEDVVRRYPEIAASEVAPLTDAELIVQALIRELSAQRQTHRDLWPQSQGGIRPDRERDRG